MITVVDKKVYLSQTNFNIFGTQYNDIVIVKRNASIHNGLMQSEFEDLWNHTNISLLTMI